MILNIIKEYIDNIMPRYKIKQKKSNNKFFYKKKLIYFKLCQSI